MYPECEPQCRRPVINEIGVHCCSQHGEDKQESHRELTHQSVPITIGLLGKDLRTCTRLTTLRLFLRCALINQLEHGRAR